MLCVSNPKQTFSSVSLAPRSVHLAQTNSKRRMASVFFPLFLFVFRMLTLCSDASPTVTRIKWLTNRFAIVVVVVELMTARSLVFFLFAFHSGSTLHSNSFPISSLLDIPDDDHDELTLLSVCGVGSRCAKSEVCFFFFFS